MSDLVPFRVVEGRDHDGVLRITLIGELDLAVADRLSARLDQLSSDRTRVRLDLSRLTFIDSSGIRVLIRAAQQASNNGERLIEFAPEVTQNVETVIGLVGAAPVLWANRAARLEHEPVTTSQDEGKRNTASQRHAIQRVRLGEREAAQAPGHGQLEQPIRLLALAHREP